MVSTRPKKKPLARPARRTPRAAPKSAEPKVATPKTATPKTTKGMTPTTRAPAKKPKLLSGDNPQIAMADDDDPVRRFIAAIPGWKHDVATRLDALVVRNVPEVYKAVKWNSPFYGINGRGWFLGFHVFSNYLKVTFFKGTSLQPVPAGGTGKDARWIDIRQEDLDEARLSAWIRQAAALPGWGKT